jgi:hypothetical protein
MSLEEAAYDSPESPLAPAPGCKWPRREMDGRHTTARWVKNSGGHGGRTSRHQRPASGTLALQLEPSTHGHRFQRLPHHIKIFAWLLRVTCVHGSFTFHKSYDVGFGRAQQEASKRHPERSLQPCDASLNAVDNPDSPTHYLSHLLNGCLPYHRVHARHPGTAQAYHAHPAPT